MIIDTPSGRIHACCVLSWLRLATRPAKYDTGTS